MREWDEKERDYFSNYQILSAKSCSLALQSFNILKLSAQFLYTRNLEGRAEFLLQNVENGGCHQLVVINSVTFRVLLMSWSLFPSIGDINPRLCPVLPKALGTFPRRCRVKVFIVSGMSPHVRGYKSSWSLAISSWPLLYIGRISYWCNHVPCTIAGCTAAVQKRVLFFAVAWH